MATGTTNAFSRLSALVSHFSPEKIRTNNDEVIKLSNEYQVKIVDNVIHFKRSNNTLGQWVTDFTSSEVRQEEKDDIIYAVLTFKKTPYDLRARYLTAPETSAACKTKILQDLCCRDLVEIIKKLGKDNTRLEELAKHLILQPQQQCLDLTIALLTTFKATYHKFQPEVMLTEYLISNMSNNYDFMISLFSELITSNQLYLINKANGLFWKVLIPNVLKSITDIEQKKSLLLTVIGKKGINIFQAYKDIPPEDRHELNKVIKKLNDDEMTQILNNSMAASPDAKVSNFSVFLGLPLRLDFQKQFILSFEFNNAGNVSDLRLALPSHVLGRFFLVLGESQQDCLQQGEWLKDPKLDIKTITSIVNKYLISSIDYKVKKELLKNLGTPLLVKITRNLSRDEKERLLCLLEDAQHIEVIDKILCLSSTNKPHHSTLNALPTSSIKLLCPILASKQVLIGNLICNTNISDDIKKILANILIPQKIEFLLGHKIDLINKLSPEIVMQLNRNLSFTQWQRISHQIMPKQLHLWTDFLNLQQVKIWTKTNRRKNEIELLCELDSSRCIALLTHFDLKIIAKKLISQPPSNVALCINKLCVHSSCLTLLELIALEENSETFLHNVLSELKFEQIKKEYWPKQREQLLESLKVLKDSSEYTQYGSHTLINVPLSSSTISQKKKATQILFKIQKATYNDKQLKLAYEARKAKIAAKLEELHSEIPIDINDKPRAICTFINEKRKQQGKPYEYYYDLTQLSPTIHNAIQTPSEQELKLMEGSSKTLVKADHQTLTFHAKRSNYACRMENRSYTIRRQLLLKLFEEVKLRYRMKLQSISPGLLGILPEDGVMVVARGGLTLSTLTKSQDTAYSLSIFNTLCYELMTMHRLRFFLGDIKPDNLLLMESATNVDGTKYRNPKPELKFIDIDEICCIETKAIKSQDVYISGETYPTCGTPGFCTLEHIFIRTGDKKKVEHIKAKDEYAMLMTILVTISLEFSDMFYQLIEVFKGKREEIIEAMTKNKTLKPELELHRKGILSVITDKNQLQLVIELIEKTFTPEYHLQIKQFLEDPLTHPLTKNKYLYDMINWEAQS